MSTVNFEQPMVCSAARAIKSIFNGRNWTSNLLWLTIAALLQSVIVGPILMFGYGASLLQARAGLPGHITAGHRFEHCDVDSYSANHNSRDDLPGFSEVVRSQVVHQLYQVDVLGARRVDPRLHDLGDSNFLRGCGCMLCRPSSCNGATAMGLLNGAAMRLLAQWYELFLDRGGEAVESTSSVNQLPALSMPNWSEANREPMRDNRWGDRTAL